MSKSGNITKESVFNNLKTTIHILIDQFSQEGKNCYDDSNFVSFVKAKQEELKKGLDSLDSCDIEWINDEYGRWLKTDPKVAPRVIKAQEMMDEVAKLKRD